jgi:hypothetical protein
MYCIVYYCIVLYCSSAIVSIINGIAAFCIIVFIVCISAIVSIVNGNVIPCIIVPFVNVVTVHAMLFVMHDFIVDVLTIYTVLLFPALASFQAETQHPGCQDGLLQDCKVLGPSKHLSGCGGRTGCGNVAGGPVAVKLNTVLAE